MRCPVCNGPLDSVGWLRNPDVQVGDEAWGSWGEIGSGACYLRCTHSDGVIQEQLSGLSGLSAGDTMLLKDFWQIEGREEALAAIQDLLAVWNGVAAIYGGYGVGKTFLLKALVNEAVAVGITAVYHNLPRLLEILRESYGKDATMGQSQILDRLYTVRVLAIDELDKARMSEWAQERLFMVLEHRYSRADTLATAVSFNDWEQVPPYLLSRFSQFKMVKIDCADLRPMAEEELPF